MCESLSELMGQTAPEDHPLAHVDEQEDDVGRGVKEDDDEHPLGDAL